MLDANAFNIDSNPSNNGFTLTFLNGITVSVRWGDMNYSDNGESTAECAAYDSDGQWVLVNGFNYHDNTVLPNLSTEDVARFMFNASVM